MLLLFKNERNLGENLLLQNFLICVNTIIYRVQWALVSTSICSHYPLSSGRGMWPFQDEYGGTGRGVSSSAEGP